jgi:hypothetical protein
LSVVVTVYEGCVTPVARQLPQRQCQPDSPAKVERPVALRDQEFALGGSPADAARLPCCKPDGPAKTRPAGQLAAMFRNSRSYLPVRTRSANRYSSLLARDANVGVEFSTPDGTTTPPAIAASAGLFTHPPLSNASLNSTGEKMSLDRKSAMSYVVARLRTVVL